MPRDKLNTIAEGIFFSLLNYCVKVFGYVWGLPTYDDQLRHSTAFRKEDHMKLQILVNRSLTGLDRDTPVFVLASTSGKLTVQQRTALFTLNTVHRAVQSHEPAYSFSVLKTEDDQAEIPHHQQNCNNTASADGGPRSRVCARLTLRSAPHRHKRYFFGAHV